MVVFTLLLSGVYVFAIFTKHGIRGLRNTQMVNTSIFFLSLFCFVYLYTSNISQSQFSVVAINKDIKDKTIESKKQDWQSSVCSGRLEYISVHWSTFLYIGVHFCTLEYISVHLCIIMQFIS